jgi:hypothetical protein
MCVRAWLCRAHPVCACVHCTPFIVESPSIITYVVAVVLNRKPASPPDGRCCCCCCCYSCWYSIVVSLLLCSLLACSMRPHILHTHIVCHCSSAYCKLKDRARRSTRNLWPILLQFCFYIFMVKLSVCIECRPPQAFCVNKRFSVAIYRAAHWLIRNYLFNTTYCVSGMFH